MVSKPRCLLNLLVQSRSVVAYKLDPDCNPLVTLNSALLWPAGRTHWGESFGCSSCPAGSPSAWRPAPRFGIRRLPEPQTTCFCFAYDDKHLEPICLLLMPAALYISHDVRWALIYVVMLCNWVLLGDHQTDLFYTVGGAVSGLGLQTDPLKPILGRALAREQESPTAACSFPQTSSPTLQGISMPLMGGMMGADGLGAQGVLSISDYHNLFCALCIYFFPFAY